MSREDRQVAAEIALAAERLREHARKAAPGRWRIGSDEDCPRLISRDHDEMAIAVGMWAAGTASYLPLVSPNTAYEIAELLSRRESTIRQGRMPSDIKNAMRRVAREINACVAMEDLTPDPGRV